MNIEVACKEKLAYEKNGSNMQTSFTFDFELISPVASSPFCPSLEG